MTSDTEIQIINHASQNPEKFFMVNDFLQLRKKVFFEKLGWTLDTYKDLEFDQYDTFQTKYVIATENGQVVGGARLLRSDAVSPVSFGGTAYTYMVKDASEGKLDGLPKGLCFNSPPVSDDVWEITRLCSVSHNTTPNLIMNKCIEFLANEGASSAIFICTPIGVRYARSKGRVIEEVGPVLENEDGKFQAISFRIDQGDADV